MTDSRGYSELYERALRFAAIAHQPQTRKGSDIPYITHLVHVSVILLRHGFPMAVVITGLLHDVVEDQGYGIGEIERRFGADVAEMVAALSEQKLDAAGHKRPWEVRKQESLAHMREASEGAVAVKVADTLHNTRCVALDVRREGPAVWQRFTRGPRAMLDYHRQILQVARECLADHPLVDELAEAVADLAQVMKETSAGAPRQGAD